MNFVLQQYCLEKSNYSLFVNMHALFVPHQPPNKHEDMELTRAMVKSAPLLRNIHDLVASEYRVKEDLYVADKNRIGWMWKVRVFKKGQWSEWTTEAVYDYEPVNTDCPELNN